MSGPFVLISTSFINSCYADLEEFGYVWAGTARPNIPKPAPKCVTSVIKEGKLDEYKAFSSPMVLLPTFSKENSP
jgi:hypothetical protein